MFLAIYQTAWEPQNDNSLFRPTVQPSLSYRDELIQGHLPLPPDRSCPRTSAFRSCVPMAAPVQVGQVHGYADVEVDVDVKCAIERCHVPASAYGAVRMQGLAGSIDYR